MLKKTIITKVVNILDECLYFASCFTNPNFLPNLIATQNLVTRKRFAKNFHKRAIAGQIDAIQVVVSINVLSCNI